MSETLKMLVRSQARVAALAEITDRYGTVVGGLVGALDGAAAKLEGDERAQVLAALADAGAQLAAIEALATVAAADLGS